MEKEQAQLKRAKLKEFIGKKIRVEGVRQGTSSFGPYVLLLTKTHAIISSNKVVLGMADELAANVPATYTVSEREGKSGNKYLVLE